MGTALRAARVKPIVLIRRETLLENSRTGLLKNNRTENLPVQPELKLNGLSVNRY
jgi:hypothetical protein